MVLICRIIDDSSSYILICWSIDEKEESALLYNKTSWIEIGVLLFLISLALVVVLKVKGYKPVLISSFRLNK